MGLWICGQRACVVHISTGSRRLVDFARSPITQCLMQTLVVVKVQPAADAATSFLNRGVCLDVYILVLQAPPQPLDEDVVQVTAFAIHADADTAGLMRTPLAASTPVNAALVNCTPWSVLKISGEPYRSSASCKASTQNPVSMPVDKRQARTRRLNQSITATKYTNPFANGMYVLMAPLILNSRTTLDRFAIIY